MGGFQSIPRLAGMSATHKGAIMIVTCLLVHQDQVQRGWRWTFMAAEGRSPNTTVNMGQVLALGQQVQDIQWPGCGGGGYKNRLNVNWLGSKHT